MEAAKLVASWCREWELPNGTVESGRKGDENARDGADVASRREHRRPQDM